MNVTVPVGGEATVAPVGKLLAGTPVTVAVSVMLPFAGIVVRLAVRLLDCGETLAT
jgi:hypothetical protein